MENDGTYTVLQDTNDSGSASTSSQIAELYQFLRNSDEPKRKSKKKKKKREKALGRLLKSSKKTKRKSKKSRKKQSKREFQYRLIEKSADTVLDTASDIAKIYAESKFFPDGHETKSK